jgi:hypothetical protein
MSFDSSRPELQHQRAEAVIEQPAETNPYASTNIIEGVIDNDAIADIFPANLFVTIGIWSFVCILSAAPSFIIAINDIAKNQAIAMVLGVLIFIGIYTSADLLSRNRPIRKDPRMRTILRSTFIVRSIMVMLFPIATATDIFLGLFSVSIVNGTSRMFHSSTIDNYDGKMGFGMTLATTLVQGCLLSGLLFLLGLFIAAIIYVSRAVMNRA